MTRGATFAIDDAIFSAISPDVPDANSRRDYVLWVWIRMRRYFQILNMRDQFEHNNFLSGSSTVPSPVKTTTL